MNGDFKVVMRSTDTNNCGETEGREDCAKPAYARAQTHTHTRTILKISPGEPQVFPQLWPCAYTRTRLRMHVQL